MDVSMAEISLEDKKVPEADRVEDKPNGKRASQMSVVVVDGAAEEPQRRMSFTSTYMQQEDESEEQKRNNAIIMYVGVFILCFNAGFINSTAIGIFKFTVSHVSGTTSKIGVDIEDEDWDLLEIHCLLVLSFCIGSFISGLLINDSNVQVGKALYGIALCTVGALLFAATLFTTSDDLGPSAKYLAAMACGLQNAMATGYSGAVIRTTHMTGVITDIGLILGRTLSAYIRGESESIKQRDMWKVRLLCLLYAGFLIGGVFGALTAAKWQYKAMYVPAVISTALGVSYMIFRTMYLKKKLLDLPQTPVLPPEPSPPSGEGAQAPEGETKREWSNY